MNNYEWLGLVSILIGKSCWSGCSWQYLGTVLQFVLLISYASSSKRLTRYLSTDCLMLGDLQVALATLAAIGGLFRQCRAYEGGD